LLINLLANKSIEDSASKSLKSTVNKIISKKKAQKKNQENININKKEGEVSYRNYNNNAFSSRINRIISDTDKEKDLEHKNSPDNLNTLRNLLKKKKFFIGK